MLGREGESHSLRSEGGFGIRALKDGRTARKLRAQKGTMEGKKIVEIQKAQGTERVGARGKNRVMPIESFRGRKCSKREEGFKRTIKKKQITPRCGCIHQRGVNLARKGAFNQAKSANISVEKNKVLRARVI